MKALFSFLLVVSFGISKISAAEIALTLTEAIDKALNNNPSLQDQKLNLKLAEITYKNAWDTMYMPNVSVTLTSTSDTTMFHLPGKRNLTLGDSHGYPTSAATLSLGSYTLFNFGKDQLLYEQAKLDWTRAKETSDEIIRNVKFQVIIAYWKLKTEMDKSEAAERSVEIAQTILDLLESRLPLGKAAKQAVNSSVLDLNNAINLRNQLKTNEKIALWALNPLLGDPVGLEYKITEQISFLPISLTEDIVYDVYLRESPSIKSSKKELKKASIALELEKLGRLPLPKVSFSGANLTAANSYYATESDFYSTTTGNKNFYVSGSVNLTLPLLGPGGLLGSRSVDQASIFYDQAVLRLNDTTNRDKAFIYQLIQNIRQAETAVENNRKSLQASSDVLSALIKQLSTGSVSRLDLKDALQQTRTSELDLSESILNHLTYKTQLAQLIGVDYLPRNDK
jgi:outer membrane protein TolC